MPLFKSKAARQLESTKALIGIDAFTEHGIQTPHGELVCFIVAPTNLAVLSESSVSERIHALSNVFKSVEQIEILCLNSKENFDENKEYLKQRMRKETNPILQKLLRQDSENLDRLQTNMSTAREFLFLVRLRDEKDHNIPSYLSRVAKCMADQGFTVKRATDTDLKRMLSVYFEQNIATDHYQNFDGEQWTAVADMCV